MRIALITSLLLTAVAGCTAQPAEGPRLIAVATDSAIVNRDTLEDEPFGIAVLPDGCQAWIGDNAAEGYAANRFDPQSGLPVCSDRLPPGAVIGNIQQTGFPDILP
ncbi:hypothetical protein [Histidinibacterium aquaticum]|uniref:Uncharacterized protein n=1 Tax=Histidinibacterium aquaticum TaxID=2613962 RepID=A0A5J5GKW6_9RHOB|nr:hypothetical protein [Histidinibacterium aquaticum]KAA9008303.1 hypothetical protein F3S47_12510 [Histidinibacterium aquaticum]